MISGITLKLNNAGGLSGYQQHDIHAIDVLRTLAFIEFATLDIQAIMQGYTEGQFAATHLATATEVDAKRIIVANAHADLYRVGQAISIGTSLGGNQICPFNRTITAIEVYDVNNKAISFDGAAVTVTTGNMVYNSGWKSGACDDVVASSGILTANDGKYPCMYRRIENPFGMWQFIDGVNITDNQAWICKDARQYASNVFASPYEQLGYVNHNANNYVQAMGYDENYPFAEFPTTVNASFKYYKDYYYQATGAKIARFGGGWFDGLSAGLSYWRLHNSSSNADMAFGGRLMRKAL